MTDNQQDKQTDSNNDSDKKPGFFSVLQSVIAAMFGVQSDSKRQQDFEKGNAAEYIVVGIIMVVVFILTIMWVVNSAIDDYKAIN
tara:strand:- start:630 stop:884 length:255 start_codon:yes stop_codon:yes gene_type:complete